MRHQRLPTHQTTHVLVTDVDLIIRWVNEGLCQKLLFDREDIIGRALPEVLAENSQSSIEELRSTMQRGEVIEKLRATFLSSKGKPVAFTFRVFPVMDVDGNTSLYMAVGGRDTRARRKVKLPRPGFDSNYQTSSLTFAEGKRYYEALQELMNAEQLYLDPEINIAKIARQLKTNTQYMSQVVNFFSGERFSTYVNLFRLRKLSELLVENARLEPMKAWEEVGFGSYSAFYRALQRHIKLSPSEFFKRSRLEGVDHNDDTSS